MNHSIKMGMIGLAVVIAVLYAGDFLLIRYKLVHHQAAVDTVQVASRYYARSPKKITKWNFSTISRKTGNA